MPLTITREAQVYRLWLDADLKQCFEDHAAVGWICSTVCSKVDSVVTWGVRLQYTGQPVLPAALSEVVVSDLSRIEVQTLEAYNAANPDNPIVEGP